MDDNAPATILVVDDTPANLHFLVSLLQREGHQVRAATGGAMGLSIARSNPVDLALLDVRMPGMDGYALCRALRDDPRAADIPIIFISALSELEDKVKGFAAGGVDYIAKPFQPEEVLARVRTHLALKAARREMAVARSAAEAANLAKSRFLANISHEIRTPLNAILGFADILEGRIADPDLRRHAASIRSSGKDLLDLLNDVLDLSRIEASRLTLSPRPTRIRHLLDGVGRLFAGELERKDVAFAIRVSEDLPAMLEIDPMRARQILINLLGNAAKFTRKGSVTLTAGCVPSAGAPGAVDLTLTVADTGIGIPEDRQKIIFENFTQADDRTSRIYGGAGLGLSISAKLAELMGGGISVESTPGQGSAFTARLPGVAVVEDKYPDEADGDKDNGDKADSDKADGDKANGKKANGNKADGDKDNGDEKATAKRNGAGPGKGAGDSPRAHPSIPDPRSAPRPAPSTADARRLQSRLTEEFLPRWREIRETLIYDEVSDFAGRVRRAGEDAACAPLVKWADGAIARMADYDLDGLFRHINAFPDLVSRLSGPDSNASKKE